MLTGKMPFKGETIEDLHEAIKIGQYLIPAQGISESAKDLLARMLCVDPVERLDTEQIFRHS